MIRASLFASCAAACQAGASARSVAAAATRQIDFLIRTSAARSRDPTIANRAGLARGLERTAPLRVGWLGQRGILDADRQGDRPRVRPTPVAEPRRGRALPHVLRPRALGAHA